MPPLLVQAGPELQLFEERRQIMTERPWAETAIVTLCAIIACVLTIGVYGILDYLKDILKELRHRNKEER